MGLTNLNIFKNVGKGNYQEDSSKTYTNSPL